MKITIFGHGNMAKAIAKNFITSGNEVQYIGHEFTNILGEIVILAVPYSAVESIIAQYQQQLANKIILDITNPVDFTSMDNLVIPAGTSAAEIIQEKLPQSQVVKGFNTNFAATLTAGTVAGKIATTVQFASDFAEAKEKIQTALQGSGLQLFDAGALKRARELEALGFLNITLAVREQISWTGGFVLYH